MPCDSAVEKDRRCVDYEILNYGRHDLMLQQNVSLSRDHCMFKCARQPSCAAINVRINGTGCELLQASSTCQVTNHVQGWVLISLSVCDGVPPWLTIRPADSGWQWITADAPSMRGAWYIRLTGLLIFLSAVCFTAASTFLAGGEMMQKDSALSTHLLTQWSNCVSNGQFISFTGSTNYTWTNYTAGNEVPD